MLLLQLREGISIILLKPLHEFYCGKCVGQFVYGNFQQLGYFCGRLYHLLMTVGDALRSACY